MFNKSQMHEEIDFRIESIGIRIKKYKLGEDNAKSSRVVCEFRRCIKRATRILDLLKEAHRQVNAGVDIRDIEMPVQASDIPGRPIMNDARRKCSYNYMPNVEDRRFPNMISLDLGNIRKETQLYIRADRFCKHKIERTNTEIIETVYKVYTDRKLCKMCLTVAEVNHYPLNTQICVFTFPDEDPLINRLNGLPIGTVDF